MNLFGVLENSELLWFRDGPLVNGGFGVSKGKRLANGLEILRWIQALVPSNSLQKPFAGDIRTLPYCGQWRALIVPEHMEAELGWGSADMAAFICLSCRGSGGNGSC